MVTTPIITFIADPRSPDLYVDVTDLPNPFTMNIPIGITNTHPSNTLWFKLSIVSPPGDYSVSSTNLGSLAIQQNGVFMFTPVRALPSLTAGEYDETLTFKVEAFTDSGYSALYTDEELSVIIHHFNHTDASWTVIDHSDFDNGSQQGWTDQSGYDPELNGYVFGLPSSSHCLSSPYALTSYAGTGATGKNVNTNGYTKARFVIHSYENNGNNLGLKIGSNVVKPVYPAPLWTPINTWFRLAFGLPITTVCSIRMSAHGTQVWIDEIWVIAK